MRIYLIGMPAAGKSTFGRELAAHLNYKFVDLDTEIEQQVGKSIPDIFNDEGEEVFRQYEQQTLLKTTPENAIIATGGGAPCFFDNLDFINKNGVSVFLDVDPIELAKRAAKQVGQRPLLEAKDEKEVLLQLKEKRGERLPFYQKANIHLQKDEIQIEKLLLKLNLT